MRDNRIDILRATGLAMIILAHAYPPALLFHLRNFDVPLMVILSGMSFFLSYKAAEPFGLYVWKRIKRLVFPVWIFLSAYLAVDLLVFSGGTWHAGNIAGRYLFISGDYLWIIRVFLLVALVAPALYRLDRRFGRQGPFFIGLALVATAYEILRYISLPFIQEGFGQGLSLISHFLVPYALLFALGMRLNRLTSEGLWAIAGAGLAFFAVASTLFYVGGGWQPTQNFKYPPSLYYFSYAVFVSCLLLLMGHRLESLLRRSGLLALVLFLGRNSIWVYLWHIPLVEGIHLHFALKYALVFAGAGTLTYIQTKIVELASNRLQAQGQKNLKILFTG